LGGNPVYDAPADLKLDLKKVKNVIHLGLAADETAAQAHWHLPGTHFLEAWGDCRSSDGTASVVQPLIEPLFGGHSAAELLGLLASGEDKPGYDLVRETWSTLLPAGAAPAAVDDAFNKVLHDGLLAGSAVPPVATIAINPATVPAEALAQLARPAAAGLELVFRASPAVHDGRFANVGWLQEMPDAVTKITWGNAALLSPKTAERLKLENEDGVRVQVGAAKVELPAWIVPGQADETVIVHLGYGRTAAGRAGTGVGGDVYPLRTSA
ncbi:MAG: hypothetical protein ABUL63_00380, partial [Acidobacteriota bacterium]